MSNTYQDVQVTFEGPVATVEMCKPPHNFFTIPLIRALADAFEDLETDRRCHAIVLAAQGTSQRPSSVPGHAGPRRRHPQRARTSQRRQTVDRNTTPGGRP